MFPYPPLMLLILSMPFALFNIIGPNFNNIMIDLFLLRIPLLLADIGILIILQRLLSNKRKELIIYYWCSPVLFYITYVHGQLDVIPILFLFISLALLFSKSIYSKQLSFLVLGAGLATKTNLFLALPFMLLYVWKQKRSLKEIFILTILSFGTFSLFTLSFLDNGFIRMVFLSEQQNRIFAFIFPVYLNLVIYVAPLLYLVIFLRFSAYRHFNSDIMMMILSLVFSIFMVIVPPRPGWFFWGIPFMIYFFVKLDSVRRFTYWALNGAYFLFFWTWKDGDFPQILQIILPQTSLFPNIYQQIHKLGFNSNILSSIMFSILASLVLIVVYWIYKRGILINEEYFIQNKPITIGIGGDSGAGKTTIANILTDTFGDQNILIINGDDMHKWERHDKNWKLQTPLNPNSNKLNLDYSQSIQLIRGKPIKRSFYDHTLGKFTAPVIIKPKKFILFVGLHPFYIKGMREIQDIRIFIDPEESLRQHWKVMRDAQERGYKKEDSLKIIQIRMPDARYYIKPQKKFSHIVISFKTIKNIVPGSNVSRDNLYLQVTLDNSIDMEIIDREFKKIKTLTVKHEYNKDCEHQTIEFRGEIYEDQIKDILMDLVPNYNSLTYYEPIWKRNYTGIIQLLILFYISERNKQIGPKYV